jgi:hypothetical protein
MSRVVIWAMIGAIALPVIVMLALYVGIAPN